MHLKLLYITFMILAINIDSSDSSIADNAMMFYNLYKSVMRGSRILRDISDGAGAVTDAMNAIDNIVDGKSMPAEGKPSVGSDTVPAVSPETTPCGVPGSESACSAEDVHMPDLTQTTACGALGFYIQDSNLPISQMTECCDVHVSCYGFVCRANKRKCDRELKKCLGTVCKSDKTLDRKMKRSCKAATRLLLTGTMAMSFQQYKNAQELLLC